MASYSRGMSHEATPSLVRHCDVAVIGGSAAGLAAALQLARQRRSVIVIDAGEPRNAPAAHMHSFLGRDGTPPAELLDAGRAEVRSYGGEVLSGRVVEVTRSGERLAVDLAAGHRALARRVVVATGLVDELPDVEGLAEHWGEGVIHCPFCHGYEARDQRIVQLVTHPMGLHTASLFHQLTADLTVVLDRGVEVAGDQVEALEAAGVTVLETSVRRIVTGADDRLVAVELDDGTRLDADSVVVGPRFRPRAEPLASLGVRLEPHPTGLGEVVVVDVWGATSVEGVSAAGNVTDPSQQVLQAAAHGSRVGAAVAVSLAEEDLRTAARPSSGAADWDHRYAGEPIWSGNPNGSLVAEASGLAPGRALDVGAGEGGDALWLAEHGWSVTAADISARALARVGAAAQQHGLEVACQAADANAWQPFAAGAYDLVSASYASIPRAPDRRGVRNVIDAVAPGGTLIVIGHDLEAMHGSQHQERPFDPDAYVDVDDFVTVLGDATGWVIETNAKRTRPPGSASAAHHADDRVLRARRTS